MSYSSLLILLAISSPLICLAQAPFGDVYACVAYCGDLRRVVSMACYMTTSECEGNVLGQCGTRGSKLFTYPFSDFDDCQNFRLKFFDQLKADVTRNEETQNDGGSTDTSNTTITPVARAQCGCQEIIYNIAWNFFSIDIDALEDPCQAVVSKFTTDRVTDFCPKGLKNNFFFGKVCNFVSDTVEGVLDVAFVQPTCQLITEVLEEGFDLPVSSLMSLGAQTLDTINSGLNSTLEAASGAVCGSLLCNKPGSLCKQITNGLGPILRATGTCSEDSSGWVIQGSVTVMIMASVLLLIFSV